jgi:hypothetical protein
MSLTTKEILNIAEEIYTNQYSTAFPEDIKNKEFKKLKDAIMKIFEARIAACENLKNSKEREYGYRRLQLDSAAIISLVKYFAYNDKHDLFKDILSNKEKENFKKKIFKNFDIKDLTLLFININSDTLIFTKILEKLGDDFAKSRNSWFIFKFDEIAIKVIKNVHDDTFNNFILSTFDSDNFAKRLLNLMMFESEKNLTFTDSINAILSGADMPYTLAAATNINSLERLKNFFAIFK